MRLTFPKLEQETPQNRKLILVEILWNTIAPIFLTYATLQIHYSFAILLLPTIIYRVRQ